MRSIFFKIIFFLIFFCWSNVSYSVEVLGTGTAALIGGDLTDPEDDGVDGENTNWNWTSISASSEEKWTHEGSFNVFDNKVGATNHKWCCNGPTQWISVGFSQPYILSHFTITSGNDVAGRDPDIWKIQGSNDGSNWTDIFVYDNNGVSPWGTDRLEVLKYTGDGDDFSTPNAFSYFRYYVTSTVSSNHQINELEYFGSADSTNPTLTSSVPADNATGVAEDANIVLNFDEIVDAETGNITIKKTSDNSTVETIDVTGGQLSGSGSTQITLDPSVTLDSSTEYYVLIDATAFDDVSGNSYAGISSTTALSFTTGDTTAPTLTSSVPADNATSVAVDSTIVLNFSESVDAESGNITIKKTSDNSTVETIDVTGGQVTGSGTSQITVTPSSDFDNDTEYYVLIDATAFDDVSGNSYAGISSTTALSFTTDLDDPTNDKDVIGLIEAQTDQAMNIFTQSLGLISSRLEYLRQNKFKNDLSRNDLNIYLGNDMLTSITKALIVPISENKNVSILPDDWSSWSKGSISITEIGDTNNSSRKEIDSQGIAFGFDKKLNDDDIYGFSAHYGQSDTDVGSSGSGIDSKNYSIAMYRTKPGIDKNFIEGTIGIGKIKSDIERKSGSNTLTGSRDGNQIFGSINFGKKIAKESFNLNPVLRIDLGYTKLEAYQEEGTDALAYDDQQIKSGLLSLGFGMNNLLKFEESTLKPIGLIEFGLDFSDSSVVNLNYVSDTSTNYTYTYDITSNYMLTSEVGFHYETNENLIINTSYKRIQGEENKHSETIIFGLNFKPQRENEYAMLLEDDKASVEYKRNFNGFDF